MAKLSVWIGKATVIGIIVAVLAALIFATEKSGWTCSKCGNEIYMTRRLTWHGYEIVVKCVTTKPITADCKHPPHKSVNPPTE